MTRCGRMAWCIQLTLLAAVACAGPPTASDRSDDPTRAPRIDRRQDDASGSSAAAANSAAAIQTFNTSDSPFDTGIDNQGWWTSTRSNFDANDNYIVGQCCESTFPDIFRNFFTFDLSTLSGTAISAKLEFRRYRPSNHVEATETYELFDVSTDAATLNNNVGTSATIFADLGSGTSYGSFTVSGIGSETEILTFQLNAAAVSDINAAAGGFFSIGGKLTSNDGKDFMFGFSSGSGVQRLVVEIETNSPPVANAGPDQVVKLGDPVTLDGLGSSDPDGTIDNYKWSEGGVTLGEGTSPTAIVTLDLGVHTITLEVTDDGSLTDEDDVVITVTLCGPDAPDCTEDTVVPNAAKTITLDGDASIFFPANPFGEGAPPVRVSVEVRPPNGVCVPIGGAAGECLVITTVPVLPTATDVVICLTTPGPGGPHLELATINAQGDIIILENLIPNPCAPNLGPAQAPSIVLTTSGPGHRKESGGFFSPHGYFEPMDVEAEVDLEDDGGADMVASAVSGSAGEDQFEVRGVFPFDNGFDPNTDQVVFTFGEGTDKIKGTIPAGSFSSDDDDEGFEFEGTIVTTTGQEIEVDMQIRDDGRFRLEVEDVDLGTLTLPGFASFVLQIGGQTVQTEGAGLYLNADGVHVQQ